MTNLLFSIITLLVTNTTERVHPGGISIYATWPATTEAYPDTKTVTTTVCRVTNAVSRWADKPVEVELGRQKLWETTEEFALVIKKEWERKGTATKTDFSVPDRTIWLTNMWSKNSNMIILGKGVMVATNYWSLTNVTLEAH